MKKISVLCLSFCAIASMSVSFAHGVDKLNLAGTYQCTGYDSYSGAYSGTVTLKVDTAASNFENNLGAYGFTFIAMVPGIKTPFNYAGEAVAHGDLLSIYYQNVDEKNATDDRGVGIATVARMQNAKGHFVTSFTKFYYEPKYLRDQKGPTGNTGGTGTEHCVRVSI